MLNYLKAELYRLVHSKSWIGFILGSVFILFLSMIFGEMTIMGSGEGMLLDIGFQAKSYLSAVLLKLLLSRVLDILLFSGWSMFCLRLLFLTKNMKWGR